MNRSPLPPRKVGLARGPLSLPRRAPLARAAMRRQPAQRPQDSPKGADAGKDWPPQVREALATRSGGMCERCGTAPGTDAHHRKRRREADHRIVNGAWLCRDDHRWAHEHPADARAEGFIVSAWSDPATVPLIVNGNRWVILRPDGTYRTDQRGWPT